MLILRMILLWGFINTILKITQDILIHPSIQGYYDPFLSFTVLQ